MRTILNESFPISERVAVRYHAIMWMLYFLDRYRPHEDELAE